MALSAHAELEDDRLDFQMLFDFSYASDSLPSSTSFPESVDENCEFHVILDEDLLQERSTLDYFFNKSEITCSEFECLCKSVDKEMDRQMVGIAAPLAIVDR